MPFGRPVQMHEVFGVADNDGAFGEKVLQRSRSQNFAGRGGTSPAHLELLISSDEEQRFACLLQLRQPGHRIFLKLIERQGHEQPLNFPARVRKLGDQEWSGIHHLAPPWTGLLSYFSRSLPMPSLQLAPERESAPNSSR